MLRRGSIGERRIRGSTQRSMGRWWRSKWFTCSIIGTRCRAGCWGRRLTPETPEAPVLRREVDARTAFPYSDRRIYGRQRHDNRALLTRQRGVTVALLFRTQVVGVRFLSLALQVNRLTLHARSPYTTERRGHIDRGRAIQVSRVWYRGCALGFHPNDRDSNSLSRSRLLTMDNSDKRFGHDSSKAEPFPFKIQVGVRFPVVAPDFDADCSA